MHWQPPCSFLLGAHGAISGEGAAEDPAVTVQSSYPSAFHTKQVIPVGSEDFMEGRMHLRRYVYACDVFASTTTPCTPTNTHPP